MYVHHYLLSHVLLGGWGVLCWHSLLELSFVLHARTPCYKSLLELPACTPSLYSLLELPSFIPC